MILCHNFIHCCNLLMHSHYQNQIGLQQRIWRDEDTSFGPIFESNTFGNHGKPGDTLESTMETWGMDSAVVFLPWATINKTSIHTISIEPGHFFGDMKEMAIGGRNDHFHRNDTVWKSHNITTVPICLCNPSSASDLDNNFIRPCFCFRLEENILLVDLFSGKFGLRYFEPMSSGQVPSHLLLKRLMEKIMHHQRTWSLDPRAPHLTLVGKNVPKAKKLNDWNPAPAHKAWEHNIEQGVRG